MMRRFHQLRRLALALSGTDEEILAYVPSDRARFESLGWAVLITSCMAMISMWFALSSALGVNGILALPLAVFWGLVIMGIDRWLITSMPVDGSRKFALAVPRVVLAVLLGTLISTPLVLRVFQSEINAQMAVMQQQNYSSFLSNQARSQVNQQVTTYSDELQQLEVVINSHGAQTGDSAADPELVSYNKQLAQLQTQLSHWTTLKSTYYTDYTCQLYGGPQCPKKGKGPAAKASYASYQQAAQEVTTTQGQISRVQQEIQQRDQFLSSASKADQVQRYNEALDQRPVVQGEYNTALERRNQLQAAFYAQEKAAHGILMRLEALSQLSQGNFTVTAARFLLFLLFLVIECLPVTVKLLQKPGQYEAALHEAKKAERKDYEKFLGTRSRFRPDQQAAGQAQVSGGQDPEARPDHVWNRTRPISLTATAFDDEPPTEAFDDPRPAAAWRAGGIPEDLTGPRQHWHGADAWRNHWGETDLGEAPPDPRVAPTRLDPRVAPTRLEPRVAETRVDYEYPRAGQHPLDDDRDLGADYYGAAAVPAAPGRPGPWPGAGYADDPVPARSDGNGGGIPLSWDDE